MVNRTNGGRRFPTLDIQRGVSPELLTYDHRGEIGSGGAMIAEAAESFGRTVQGLAESAAKREGEDAAAGDLTAQKVTAQNRATVFGQSYNAVAADAQLVQRRAALREGADQALLDHGDSPANLAKALDSIRHGLGATQFPEADLRLDGDFALMKADLMGRSHQALKAKMVDQAKANFATTLTASQALLDQTASGATFDPAGGQRVAGAMTTYINDLAKYGPKTAFEVAGVQFPADETRIDALPASEIARQAVAAQAQARGVWIQQAAEQLPDSGARRRFIGELRTKWQAGDAMLSGLDGRDMEVLTNRLEADANRAETDENTVRRESAQTAGDMLEALQFGADVDTDAMIKAAVDSGDEGLIARARLYADADRSQPGVLRQVAREALGLGAPTGAEWLTGGQPRGMRNNNPGNLKLLAGGKMWDGQIGTDGEFAVFASRDAGIRAAQTNLRSYVKQGIDTVEAIIGRWAPPSDSNDTPAYVARVAGALGVDPKAKLSLDAPGVLDKLSNAMFAHENGPAWSVAGSGPPDAFVQDPVDYARGQGKRPPLASVPALPIDAPATQDPETLSAWGTAMRTRRALGQQLAAATANAPRMLTNGERSQYATMIEDPEAALKLASAAQAPQGAAALFREIGGDPGKNAVMLHLADAAAQGQGAFARRAAEGLRLAETGTVIDKDDAADLKQAMDRQAGALRRMPSVTGPALKVAQAAYVADKARGRAAEPEFYVAAALGMTPAGDRRYGGPSTVNGTPTLAPRWLDAGRLDDALQLVAKGVTEVNAGPVYSNGQPIPALSLAQMTPVLGPDGRYGLMTRDGRPVAGRDGKPFALDLERWKPFLRANLGPAAVMGSSQ